ncbi:MAG TPA: alpha/beta hydrolase [Vicinamibacterales bacterium]|nr:alpha/beta hydrolase [Vicinamibacterales bacterium]
MVRRSIGPSAPPLWPLDPATREREYSPSSAIGGNYAPYLERYRVESARAHAAVPVRRDLRYGTAPRATLDFFPAPAGAARPGLLVYIHGGYWQELSKDESAFLAPAWHAAGFAHAVIGYTLAPEARLPGIAAECRAALAWLHAQAAALGFAPDEMVVAGSSAGAYLAAACADRSPVPIRGVVAVSGVYDVAPLIGTSVNDALGLDPSTAAALDLLAPERRFVSAVVAWGEIETSEFKRQSRAFAARLAAAGTPGTSLEIRGRNHFDVVLELGDPAAPLFAAARRLFATAP